jgi:hypothetical protein
MYVAAVVVVLQRGVRKQNMPFAAMTKLWQKPDDFVVVVVVAEIVNNYVTAVVVVASLAATHAVYTSDALLHRSELPLQIGHMMSVYG